MGNSADKEKSKTTSSSGALDVADSIDEAPPPGMKAELPADLLALLEEERVAVESARTAAGPAKKPSRAKMDPKHRFSRHGPHRAQERVEAQFAKRVGMTILAYAFAKKGMRARSDENNFSHLVTDDAKVVAAGLALDVPTDDAARATREAARTKEIREQTMMQMTDSMMEAAAERIAFNKACDRMTHDQLLRYANGDWKVFAEIEVDQAEETEIGERLGLRRMQVM